MASWILILISIDGCRLTKPGLFDAMVSECPNLWSDGWTIPLATGLLEKQFLEAGLELWYTKVSSSSG